MLKIKQIIDYMEIFELQLQP